MTSRRMFALFLGLLLLVCPLLVACGDNESDVDDTSSTTNTTSGGTTSNNTDNVDSKYLDDKGMYTLDNMNMPAFDFAQDTFTVCVYSDTIQDTYHSEEIEPIASTDDALKKGVTDRNDLIEEKYGVAILQAVGYGTVKIAIHDPFRFFQFCLQGCVKGIS